jgi:hypothetical protein
MYFIQGRTFVIYTYRETEIGEGKFDQKPLKKGKENDVTWKTPTPTFAQRIKITYKLLLDTERTNRHQCFGSRSRSALNVLFWIKIRIGNADPDLKA